MPVGNIQGADALGRLRFLFGFFLVFIVKILRLELRFAEMTLDAVPIEYPKSGPWIHPAKNHHVAGNGFEEQSARMLFVQVVQIRHYGDVQSRFQD